MTEPDASPTPSDDDACDVTVWYNPRCSKCRGARDLLDGRDLHVAYREYLVAQPTVEDLRHLMGLLGITDPRAMMRTGEAVYREKDLAAASGDDLLDAIVADPILLERPIVVVGDRAVIARPPELLETLLS